MVEQVSAFLTHHLEAMAPLVSRLDGTKEFLEHQQTPDAFDWDATQSRIARDGADEFYKQWQELEDAHCLHTSFCDAANVEFVDVAKFVAIEAELGHIRNAVVACSLVEVGTEALQAGESRASVLRECRAGLLKQNLHVPVMMPKVVRHRQPGNS